MSHKSDLGKQCRMPRLIRICPVCFQECLLKIRLKMKKIHQTPLKWQMDLSNELPYDKTNKMACAPIKDSDQPGHPPSLIRDLAVRMKKAWVLSYLLSAQRRLWSDWADAQADLSLIWAHNHFVGFVMRRFKLIRMAKSARHEWVKPISDGLNYKCGPRVL